MISDVTGDPYFQWLTQGGSVGILAAAVLAFRFGWIVPGWAYKQMKDDRDKALSQLDKQGEIAQRALEVLVRKGS
jgi:hypothetical protein